MFEWFKSLFSNRVIDFIKAQQPEDKETGKSKYEIDLKENYKKLEADQDDKRKLKIVEAIGCNAFLGANPGDSGRQQVDALMKQLMTGKSAHALPMAVETLKALSLVLYPVVDQEAQTADTRAAFLECGGVDVMMQFILGDDKTNEFSHPDILRWTFYILYIASAGSTGILKRIRSFEDSRRLLIRRSHTADWREFPFDDRNYGRLLIDAVFHHGEHWEKQKGKRVVIRRETERSKNSQSGLNLSGEKKMQDAERKLRHIMKMKHEADNETPVKQARVTLITGKQS